MKEQVLAAAVVGGRPHIGHRDGVQRAAQGAGVRRSDDAAVGEHHQVRVMNRHQRREEERLGVLEVFAENLVDVLRIEVHACGLSHRSRWR
jgi:hypothetical protein